MARQALTRLRFALGWRANAALSNDGRKLPECSFVLKGRIRRSDVTPLAALRLIGVVDTDHDGERGGDEIARAAAGLASLDKDKDRELCDGKARRSQAEAPAMPPNSAPPDMGNPDYSRIAADLAGVGQVSQPA